ncbi:hypothetical protein A2U01_0062733, partial [Trifolium medium]|nr:hypothetical protein [Trifolium medium]
MASVNNNTIPEHVAENNLQTEYEQVHEPYVPSDPLVIPLVQPGAPMETIMAALVNAINRQGDFIHEQNQRIMAQ